MNFEQDHSDGSTVKLQSDQFIIHPVSIVRTVLGDSKEFVVDLALQSCQCKDFLEYRSRLPIGDPRRFCRHLVQVQTQFSDDLHPFVRSIFEARESSGEGLPNGTSFAFFEFNGRLAFVGENRDRTSYFFITGQGNSFHEFVYNRNDKAWIGGKPDEPAPLLKFAFHARNQYGKQLKPEESNPKKARRKRRESNVDSESNLGRYLFLALVTAALAAGGYYYFQNKDAVDNYVKKAIEKPDPTEDATDPDNASLKASDKQPRRSKSEKKPPATRTQPTKRADSGSKLTESEKPGTTETNLPEEPAPQPEYRDWNYSDGSFLASARYKSYQNGQITLVRKDTGEEIKVQKSELSEQDQNYVTATLRERRLQRARQRKNR